MNYQKYASKAYAKLKKYGSTILITHSGEKVYDPETDEYVDSGTSVTGVAVQLNYSQRDIDGTNIRMGDIQFLASLNGRPLSNDKIEFGGQEYTVVRCNPISPNGKTDIVYMIQAR